VNKAYENDFGQLETQHKFSSSYAVSAFPAHTEKGRLVCVLSVKINPYNKNLQDALFTFNLFQQLTSMCFK